VHCSALGISFLGASAALQAKTEKKAQSDETIAKGLRALKVRPNVACCMLHAACCMLHVACCMLHVACCMLRD
jgi:hypothetical protein